MTISQDSAAPLIVVVGSTGTQGGSVVDNLAASDKPYRIRGLTRDSSKKQATSLAERGVEVVQCNLTVDNVEGIRKAFQGATYIFVGVPLPPLSTTYLDTYPDGYMSSCY